MKNLVNVVNGLVDAMFEDIAHTDLVTSECLIKTRYDMYHAFARRGLPFYTITMPACSKFLESFLETGEMKHERPPYHGGITKDDQRPRFMHSLWARISSDSGQLLAEPCPKSIFFLRQVYNLFKKLDMDCKQVYVDQAVKDWLHIENELPRSHQDTWDSEIPVWSLRTGHPLWSDTVVNKESKDLFAYSLRMSIGANSAPSITGFEVHIMASLTLRMIQFGTCSGGYAAICVTNLALLTPGR
jgi:hypothetical protein